MSESTQEAPAQPAKKKGGPKVTQSAKAKLSRRTQKKRHRDKLTAKIRADREFAKSYFDARSKRSKDKKVAFRKRYTKSKGAAAAAS